MGTISLTMWPAKVSRVSGRGLCKKPAVIRKAHAIHQARRELVGEIDGKADQGGLFYVKEKWDGKKWKRNRIKAQLLSCSAEVSWQRWIIQFCYDIQVSMMLSRSTSTRDQLQYRPSSET